MSQHDCALKVAAGLALLALLFAFLARVYAYNVPKWSIHKEWVSNENLQESSHTSSQRQSSELVMPPCLDPFYWGSPRLTLSWAIWPQITASGTCLSHHTPFDFLTTNASGCIFFSFECPVIKSQPKCIVSLAISGPGHQWPWPPFPGVEAHLVFNKHSSGCLESPCYRHLHSTCVPKKFI